MSVNNRRRRRRKSRGNIIKHPGAFRPRPKRDASLLPDDSGETIDYSNVIQFRAGAGRAYPRPPSKRVWAKHTVDTDKAVYGSRNATRRVSGDWAAVYLAASKWPPSSFIRGKGLQKLPARFAFYVKGKCRGYTADSMTAVGWKRAAEEVCGKDTVTLVEEIAS